jgi:hypothetical protein
MLLSTKYLVHDPLYFRDIVCAVTVYTLSLRHISLNLSEYERDGMCLKNGPGVLS